MLFCTVNLPSPVVSASSCSTLVCVSRHPTVCLPVDRRTPLACVTLAKLQRAVTPLVQPESGPT